MRNVETSPALVRPRAVRIGRLHRVLAAAMHDLLAELADFDADEVWRDDGSTDMVSWMTFELGLLPRTARAWLEVARRLDELPELRRRLAAGEMSLEQVRPLCRIATPDDEAELADIAVEMTPSEVERMVRKAQHVPKRQLDEDEPRRSVTWWWDQDDRFMNLAGKLPAAEGALVEKALLRIATRENPQPIGPEFRPLPEKAADALALIASEALGRDGDPDRATIVVHVSAADLAGAQQGSAVIEDGPVIAIETARRLAWDSRWLTVVDGPGGAPLGVGRTTRRIPAWLVRLVRKRDEGCRFPGCGRTRWTHSHHIAHWADGGPTDLDNLVTLCGFHHRQVHNQGWAIRGNPNGTIEWWSPHGWKLEPARRLDADELATRWRLDQIDEMYEHRLERAGPAP